jgi:hypothetical protein
MSDTTPDIVEAVKAKATDGRIACPVARKLAEDLGVPYKAVGDAANEAGVKVKACDLGCF